MFWFLRRRPPHGDPSCIRFPATAPSGAAACGAAGQETLDRHGARDADGRSVPPGKSRKRRAAAKTGQTVIAATAAPAVTEDQRRGMIALSAYLRAERRGFSPEGQAEDWLAAEQEVDALLNSGHTAPQ